MASADQAVAELIDPAILSAWRRIAADAATLKTPLAAVMNDSLKVGPGRTAAAAAAAPAAATTTTTTTTTVALQLCRKIHRSHAADYRAGAAAVFSRGNIHVAQRRERQQARRFRTVQ
jgi:hypothetical protein